MNLEDFIGSLSPTAHSLVKKGYQNNSNYPSRSEADFRVICEMIEKGYSDEVITEIFDTYPIGEKHKERPYYLPFSIKKAREKRANNPTQNNFIADPALWNGRNLKSAEIAEKIRQNNHVIYSGSHFYQYTDGHYKMRAVEEMKKLILDLVGFEQTRHKINEILDFLQTLSYVKETELNTRHFLNLQNCILDLKAFTTKPHSSEYLSTIQLQVNYIENFDCPLWKKTLNEIFENDYEKIEILQEFFGLCLTTETKYEKALFLLGYGGNGKSLILFILQEILGHENYSAISLDKFSNSHYTATLFNKLANISIETNAKSEVYDSVFKSIASGDEIEADYKFKNTFRFRPYCKLIFALNNMPRVDDKTEGFFRKIIILRFNRQFTEKEQDKNLKNKLFMEIDGIFQWALLGLRRLQARGYFDIPDTIQLETLEYKKENNSVISFVEENCLLTQGKSCSKRTLYREYCDWCKECNYYPLGRGKFGKELLRLFKNKIGEKRTGEERLWTGIIVGPAQNHFSVPKDDYTNVDDL